MRFLVSTLASVSLLLASSSLTWAASQAVESGLTDGVLDNATYWPRDAANFGETVQLVGGSSSGTLFGPIGGIHQDSYVFGDLNGDGADDAVAIVIENQSGLASGLQIVLAVYVNDAGAPTFADSVALGRATAVDTVTVDSGIVTVSGLQVGPTDAFCCPKQPFVQQFTLTDTRLVAAPQSEGARAPSTGGVQPGAPEIISLKSEFPGQVLIPPFDLQPFASLQMSNAHAGASFVSLATGAFIEYSQSYSVLLVNLTEQNQRQFGVASASITGALSKQMYDDTAATVVKTFTGCAATAAYCVRTTFPCTGIPCIKQAEVFRGLTVKGSAALVEHVQQERAWGWSITWFDPQAGVSYMLTTANGADPADLDKGLSAQNQPGAQQLVALAEQLVPLSGA